MENYQIKFSNKIDAIKVLRCQVQGHLEVVDAKVGDGYSFQPMVRIAPLGLKDAKDFVEAIMELGARQEREKLKRIAELVEQLRMHTNPVQF